MDRNDNDLDRSLRLYAYSTLALCAVYWYACQWVDVLGACCM